MRAEDTLGGLLGKSSRLLGNRLQKNLRLAGSDITVQQWILLAELWTEDGLCPIELSQRLLKSKASITSLLKGVERAGYVDIVGDGDDHRVKRVCLTKRGQELEADLIPIAIDTVRDAVDGIDPDQLVRATDVLKQIIGNLTVEPSIG